MEKVYIVYEMNYGDLILECDAANILGVYKNHGAAIEKVKELIKNTLDDGYYILDEERNNIERDNYVRFFYKCQENWNDYFEICIEEKEIK